jgi:TolB-like protein
MFMCSLGRCILFWAVGSLIAAGGCALAPDARHRERFHNPLPQLHRVAVLPFFNQSSDPTLDEIAVAEAYYGELQAIPGFEVIPIGVTSVQWREYQAFPGLEVDEAGQLLPSAFQKFAREIGADAVVVGSVTDFDPYSPPRMAITTRWYAANPAFHPVPAGYGLPWGTKAEKRIPRRIVMEAELEVARAQLATQTPPILSRPIATPNAENLMASAVGEDLVGSGLDSSHSLDAGGMGLHEPHGEAFDPNGAGMVAQLPVDWPDPTRLIPEPPNPLGAPEAMPQFHPIMSHTRIYRGDDPDLTEKLAAYVYARDDGRLGGWQGYLTRSDDFIRFCCYLHITEMLEMRGGRDQSDLIFRWPISRYWR